MSSTGKRDRPADGALPKLELVREAKLHRLLKGKEKESRLEASGVTLIDERVALVLFDNLNYVARVDLSLEPGASNRLLPAPSLGEGYEDIAVDASTGHVFCLIEALEDVDGMYRGCVTEFDPDLRFLRCTRLATEFKNPNKGFEGLAHVRLGRREWVLALQEAPKKGRSRKRRGRIGVFERADGDAWKHARSIDLPSSLDFADYASVALGFGQIAVVSQESARLWVARHDKRGEVVPRTGAIYRFPKKTYGNVEGIAWLSKTTLVAVSGRRKPGQPKRDGAKDQSIHVFRIPSRNTGGG